MNDVILDASFVLKWILPEEKDGVREARGIREEILRGKLRAIVPELLTTEILNVLFWKKINEEVIMKFLGKIDEGGMQMVPISDFDNHELLEVMKIYGITIFDAYYVVLAKRYKCKLMSFDKKITDIFRS